MAQTRKKGNTAAKKRTTSAAKKKAPAKKAPAKRSTAARKPSASNTKKKTSAAKTAQSAAKAAGSERQVGAIVLFAVAVFLLFVAIIPGGNAWAALQGILFGLFGVISYVIPFLLIYVAVMTSLDRDIPDLRAKIIETLVLIVLVCAAVDIFGGTGPNPQYGEAIKDAYLNGKADHNGGAVGAIVGDALMILFDSKVAAGITDLLLIFVFILLISGTTLAKFFRGLWTPVQKASDATSEHFEERVQRNEERRRIREEERAQRQRQRFNPDVDLGPDPNPDAEPLKAEKPKAKPKKAKPAAPKADAPIADNIYAFRSENEIADPPKANTKTDSKKTAKSEEPKPDVKLDDIIQRATQRSTPVQPVKAEEPVNAVKEPAVRKPAVQIDQAAADATEKALDKAEEESKPIPQYRKPPLDCLAAPKISLGGTSAEELRDNAEKLVEVLQNFGVKTSIVDIERGPSVTRYELAPAPGVKISRITNLSDDIALNLAASGVRIEAPIPNKAAVGIEVPNKKRETVTLREILESEKYQKGSDKSKLNVALGRDIAGQVCMTDIAKMPHLLIAGTTGSGKSVCLNAMILSILYNATPDEVKLVMIDPKKVEFSVYNGIPHLLIPVVSDPHKASGALAWAVKEMLKRYKTFSENNVRDIRGYNELCEMDPDKKKMPQIVIFIDELADLMMASPAEVEDSICRLAQMARAAGMHLVIATQRPSVDVITGLIKANIPSRLSLSVSSAVDSRTILDMGGAEKLLGNGDMLFNPIGNSKPTRIQGCFTSDKEVEEVVNFIKTEASTEYDENIMDEIEKEAVAAENANKKGSGGGSDSGGGDSDPLITDAIQVVVESGQASTTLIQRKLRVGYARAARIVDELEERGIIGPFEGSKPRKVLITKQQWLEMNAMSPDGADSATAAAIDLGVDNGSDRT